MASYYANTVKFQIEEKVKWGEAINIELDCLEYRGQSFQMECIQMEHKNVWESELIFFSPELPDNEIIKYRYFVAPYRQLVAPLGNNDYVNNRRYLRWQNSDNEIMELQLKRSVCRQASSVVYDKRIKEDDKQEKEQQEQSFCRRITSRPMSQIVTINCTIKRQIPEGRWIYSMIMPNSFDFDQINGDLFLKAQKMQRFRLKNTTKCLWKYTWIFTLRELQILGHSINLAFFNSYSYRRMKKYWLAMLPDGTKGTPQQIAQMLQRQGIPYQIQIEDPRQQNNKVIKSTQELDEFTLKTKFIYEITKDIREPDRIFCVCVVSKVFGRQRMVKSHTNPKFWEAQIAINADQLEGLEYYFEVNIIDRVQNEIHVSQPAKIANIIKGVPLIVRSSLPIATSYKGCNYAGSSGCFTNCSTSTRSTSNYYQNYSGNSNVFTQYTNLYYPWSYQPSYSATGYCGSGYYPGTRQHSYSATGYCGSGYYPGTRYRPRYQHSYSSTNTTIHTPQTKVFSAAQSIYYDINRIYHKQNYSPQNQAIGKSIKRLDHIVNSIINYDNEKNGLILQRNRLMNMDSSTILHVKVKQLLKPIKLKLILKTQIQQISDDFKTKRQALEQKYPEVSNKLQKLRNFRNIGDGNVTKIITNNFGIFVIEIVAAVKDWAVNQFHITKQSKIVQLLKRIGIPAAQDAHAQTTILTLCYHINQYLINKMGILNQVQALGCQHCRQYNVMKIIYKPLIDSAKIQGKQTIQNNQLYQQIIKLIEYPFNQMKLLASQQSIILQFDQKSDKIMHTLLAYAMIYSLSRHYWEQFPEFLPLPCEKFVKFCSQAPPYSKQFKLATLLTIKQYLVQQNKQKKELLKENEEKMVEMEKQVVALVQQTTQTELFNLSLIEKELQKSGQFSIDINMGDEADYEQQLEDIDNIIDERQKFARVRSILNHKYLQAVTRNQ